MFYKDLYSWTAFKLKRMRALFYTLYFIFSTVVPVVIIGYRYQLFAKVNSYRLTGIGLIVTLVIVTVGVKKLLQVIEDMDDVDKEDQTKKFTLQLIIALIIPVSIGAALWLLESNWAVAAKTVRWCLASWVAALFIEYIFCKPLDVAKRIRKKAKEQIAVNAAVEAELLRRK